MQPHCLRLNGNSWPKCQIRHFSPNEKEIVLLTRVFDPVCCQLGINHRHTFATHAAILNLTRIDNSDSLITEQYLLFVQHTAGS